MSGERFPVDEGWLLFAPVADYMTADGRRIDRVGVEPDIPGRGRAGYQGFCGRALRAAFELVEAK